MENTESDDKNKDFHTVDYVPEIKDRPLYQSFDLPECPGIFAGEYPGNLDENIAKRKINQMIQFGINHFIDLTEENELAPYKHLLPSNATYIRFPIRDRHTPESIDQVHNLLSRLKEIKKNDGFIYIHCWGGVGRTGTILGCLIADFLDIKDLNEVLKILRRNFSKMPKASYRKTPENKYQIRFINDYIQSLS